MSNGRRFIRQLNPVKATEASKAIFARIELLKQRVQDFTITLQERRELQWRHGVTHEELVRLAWYK